MTEVLPAPSPERHGAGAPTSMPMCVAVTGAPWGLGRRVVARLESVEGLEVVAAHPGPTLPEGCEVMVHVVPGDHDALALRRRSAIEGTREVLRDATRVGAGHVVLLSSALVYGAWPDNPVPLTEDAPLRPDSQFAFARQLAAVEQMVDDWRLARRGRSATVLRPVLAMAADGTSSLARALAAGMGDKYGEDDAPAQFVHLEDLVAAVELAVVQRLDGVFNVAPDGWVPGVRVRALSGSGPRLRLPDRVADVVARARWRFQRGPIPPGLRPYTLYPWLVANDRLRAAGWAPTVTNEQVFVEGTEGRWWTMLTPKRKQELALAAMVTTIGGLGAGVGLALKRAGWTARRRHR